MSEAIARAALDLVGTRFRHQGRDPRLGIDCLGLIVLAIGDGAAAVDQTDYSERPDGKRLCAALGRYFERLDIQASDAPPGCIMAFCFSRHASPERVRHVAIRTERGMVHSLRGVGVHEVPISGAWALRCHGVYRWQDRH